MILKNQSRILVIAGSGTYQDNRKFLPDSWTNIDIELGVASKEINMTPPARLFAHLIQDLRLLPLLGGYTVVLSTGTMNGLLLAVLQTIVHRKKPRHVIIDNALPLFAPANRSFLVAVAKVIFSSVDRVICFAKLQRDYWNRSLGYSDKAVFVYLGFQNYYLERKPATCKDYIFSGGRSARDYTTFVEAVKGLDSRVVIVAGRDSLRGKVGLPIDLPANVEVVTEVDFRIYLKLLFEARIVVVPLLDVPFVCGQSVLIHAMTAGKAVIATRGVSTMDYVVDNETGLLVEPGNVSELQSKIVYLLNHPDEVERLGHNALIASGEFTQDKMATAIGSVIVSS